MDYNEKRRSKLGDTKDLIDQSKPPIKHEVIVIDDNTTENDESKHNLKRKLQSTLNEKPVVDPKIILLGKIPKEQIKKNALSTLHEMFRSLNVKVTSEQGPTKEPLFTSVIEINGMKYYGQGRKKKLAKHAAAEAALKSLVQIKNPVGDQAAFSSSESPDFSGDVVYEEVSDFDGITKSESSLSMSNGDGNRSNHDTAPQPSTSAQPVHSLQPVHSFQPAHSLHTVLSVQPSSAPTSISPSTSLSSVLLRGLLRDDSEAGGVKKFERKPISLAKQSRMNIYTKNPVMLLNELHPSARYELVSESGNQANKYTMAVFIEGRRFEGQGSSKKLSKAAAARSALSIFYNVAVPEKPLIGMESVIPERPGSMPQKFADHLAQLIMDKFDSLVPKCSVLYRRKVLAGFVLSENYDLSSCKVVTLSTGTKCINGEKMSVNGTVLNDSHAEILSRRALCNFFYSELEKHADENKKDDSIFEEKTDGGFKLKPQYKLHLYINTAPCGDARIFSPSDLSISEDKHPNRKARGQLRTKIECGEGTIPVKSASGIQTWDGVLLGERLLTMSCSDKLAKWNVVGIQGALLANFVEPIYLDSLILGSLFHPGHLYRAVCGRMENTSLKLNPPFRLNKPTLSETVNTEKRQVGKTPTLSINWSLGEPFVEVINAVTGRTDQNSISRICKCRLFYRFLNLLEKIPTTSGLIKPEGPVSYSFCKESAQEFQAAKATLFKSLLKAGLGQWIKKPLEVDQFEWDIPALNKLFDSDRTNSLVSSNLTSLLNSEIIIE